MAQKFLSIKNFEKYQHYKHRNPPWIKLYNCLLDDYAFSKLPTSGKYLYLGLLILCSRHANRLPNDCTWIARALHMDESEIDLTPLYRSGLLLASRNHVASILHENAPSETEKSRDRVETETETEKQAAASPSALSRLESFLITPELEAWAAKEDIPAVHSYLEEFKDYWRSVGGKRKSGQPIKDWAATFKNRLRDLKKSGKLKTASVWGD